MPYTTQYIVLLLVEIFVIDMLSRAYFKGVVSYACVQFENKSGLRTKSIGINKLGTT